MQALKYDRCGKYYNIFDESERIDLHKDDCRYGVIKNCWPNESIDIDLCLNCKKKLAEWMKGDKDEQNSV